MTAGTTKITFRKRWSNWIKSLHKFVDRSWYDAMVAVMAGLDYFLIFFPIDVLLLTRMLLRRDRWLQGALLVALGSGIGAWALAWFVQWDINSIMSFLGRFIDLSSPEAIHATEFIRQYGIIGVTLIALSFIPPQIAVIIAAIEKVPIMSIFFSVFIARGIKYSVYSMICVYFPKYAEKWIHHHKAPS